MTRHEAIVSLGLDVTSLKRGIATFGSDFRHSLNHLAKEWGGAFAVGGVIAGIEKILDKFDQLKDKADSLDVGTDFLQGMQHISSRDAVGGVESFNRAIAELSVRLGAAKDGSKEAIDKFEKLGISMSQIAGSSAEEMFYLIADSISRIPDPAMRTAAAFDILGKSGKGMAGIMSQGSDALRKMVDETSKLDSDSVKALAEAKDRLEDLGNTATVVGGKIVSLFAHEIPKALGEMSVGLDNIRKSWAEESRVKVEAERKIIQDKVDAEIDAEKKITAAKNVAVKMQAKFERGETTAQLKEKADLQLKLADLVFRQMTDQQKMVDLNRKINDDYKNLKGLHEGTSEYMKIEIRLKQNSLEYSKLISEEQRRTASAAKDQADRQERINALKRQLAGQKNSEFMPTLSELAEKGIYQREAQRLQWLEQDAKDAMLFGDKSGFKRDTEEIQSIRDRLSKAGVFNDPNKSIVDELEKLTKPVSEGKGLPVSLPVQ